MYNNIDNTYIRDDEMKIFICDDQPQYIQQISEITTSFMEKNKLSTEIEFCGEIDKIVNYEKNYYDIALLDIEIGSRNGIEIGKKLKKVNPNIVIFIITAYEKYLDDAMDLNVLRFITKPIDRDRLESGLEKALEQIDNTVLEVYLVEDKSTVKLPVSDIIFIEISGRRTKIVTKNQEFYSSKPMKYWREKLNALFFYLIHTSYIVNMKHITSYEKEFVVLDNQYKIPIAFRKQTDFKKYFVKYFSGR